MKGNIEWEKRFGKILNGYEGLYQVSNLGNVKSLNYNHTGKIKKLRSKSNGYGYLQVCFNKKIRKTYYVHRLVAEAFIPNPENKREVNHINGIKTDNRIENLEWVSSSENTIHSYKNGLQKPKRGKDNYFYGKYGELHPCSKKIKMMDKNGDVIEVFETITSAEIFINKNNGNSNIVACCRGRRKSAYGYRWPYI